MPADIAQAPVYFAQTVSSLCASAPGQYGAVISIKLVADPKLGNAVMQLFQQAGAKLV